MRQACEEIEAADNRAATRGSLSTRRLLTNDNKQLFYCQISKNACTLWTSLLGDANLNYRPIQDTNYFAVHTTRMDEANITLHQRYSRKFNAYTKFLVVRHPLDRILSAYYNIVDRKSNLGPDRNAVNAVLDMHHVTKGTLTFSQFVAFLTSQHPKTFDKHWDSYYNLCQVCSVIYDYVIYFENMAVDGKPILRALGWPENHLARARKINPRTKTSTMTGAHSVRLSEYGVLDPELLNKLLRRYKTDMDLFAYTFDVETLMTGVNLTKLNRK